MYILHTVMSPCENNICQNNGTCVKHVLTYICECPDGYVGAFCQEEGNLLIPVSLFSM